jgi:hypothetical protein
MIFGSPPQFGQGPCPGRSRTRAWSAAPNSVAPGGDARIPPRTRRAWRPQRPRQALAAPPARAAWRWAPARHESGQLQPRSWHQRRQPLHELQPWGEPVRHRRTDTSMRLRSWLAGPSWPSASPAGPAGMRSGAERSQERQPRVLDKGGRSPAGLAQVKCPGSARARAVVGARSSQAGSARLPTSSTTRNTLPGWRHRRH